LHKQLASTPISRASRNSTQMCHILASIALRVRRGSNPQGFVPW